MPEPGWTQPRGHYTRTVQGARTVQREGSMRFADKVVWITGASSGIGEALAYAFHAEGAHVILSARRRSELERVREACAAKGAGEAMVLPLDLADAAALADKVKAALDRFGHIDILVNNAGVSQRALVDDTGMAVYHDLFEVNFFGPLALTKLVLPSMIARRSGHVVVVSSIAARFSSPLRSGYNASKKALHGLFDSLRAELWAEGVAVTLLVLGAVRTGISANAMRGDGSIYGRINRIQAEGMSTGHCAARILDAVARRRQEVMIASLPHRLMVWRSHFFPRLAARALRLKPRHRTRT